MSGGRPLYSLAVMILEYWPHEIKKTPKKTPHYTTDIKP